jgi:hypothetical protein
MFGPSVPGGPPGIDELGDRRREALVTTLGIDLAVTAAHVATLADERGEQVWSRRRFYNRRDDFDALMADVAPAGELRSCPSLRGRTSVLCCSRTPSPATYMNGESSKEVTIPESLVLIPGVIDTSSNYVERPQAVADRIVRLANIVGRDRVVAGTDWGSRPSPPPARPPLHRLGEALQPLRRRGTSHRRPVGLTRGATTTATATDDLPHPTAAPPGALPPVPAALRGDPALVAIPNVRRRHPAQPGYHRARPLTRGGPARPILLAATVVGMLIATIWAAAWGQNVTATLYGRIYGFYISYVALSLGAHTRLVRHRRRGSLRPRIDEDASGRSVMGCMFWDSLVVVRATRGVVWWSTAWAPLQPGKDTSPTGTSSPLAAKSHAASATCGPTACHRSGLGGVFMVAHVDRRSHHAQFASDSKGPDYRSSWVRGEAIQPQDAR